ncbi:Sec23-binding domain of Sec16-domain-containing protein [Xylaria nigripes]|nr:Sec23-binding domain of Sec16-domain-containing protein [Xylaria nigripes]
MDSDTTSASWHPAKRPNSSATDNTFDTKFQSGHDDSSTYEIQSPLVMKEEASTETTETSTSVQSISEKASAQSPNLEDDEEPGASRRDIDLYPEAAARPHEGAPPSNDGEDGTIVAEIDSAGRMSKHQSTVSFTRTVPHEVSFNDEEDTEWNAQPSETDPFSFMPENDSTNSFPGVSQATSSTARQPFHSGLSTDTEQSLQDLGTEEVHANAFYSAPDAIGESENNHITKQEEENNLVQHTMDGSFKGTDAEASDARYEEGLPLISRHDTGADSTDIFAQDSVETGDDFFAQIQDNSQLPADPSLNGSLQRKSTSMVMGQGVQSEPASPQDTVGSKVQDSSNLNSNGDLMHLREGGAESTNETTDLDAKWAAAFADDDDDGFLLDTVTESKELDPADIFGSDDEGFLDDAEEPTPVALAQPQSQPPSFNGRSVPELAQQQPGSMPNPYAPAPAVVLQQHPPYSSNVTPLGIGYGVLPPKPDVPKAQSFADKSRGGYQSPYDLPMEVVKPPRKRASAQQLPRVNATPPTPQSVPPPRNSTYAQFSPSAGSSPNLSSPGPSFLNQQTNSTAQKTTPQLKSKSSFFEDLPVTSRSRPSSRQSIHHGLTQSPYGQLRASSQGPPMNTVPSPSLPSQQLSAPPTTDLPTLVAPERISPYAPLHSDASSKPQPPSAFNSRYSPAPPHTHTANGTMPTPPTNRYSPAPPNSRSSASSYAAAPSMLAHQPRTSSPLAHFEVTHGKPENKYTNSVNGDGVSLIRTNSSQYDHRITRISSLPPTQEVEEEQLLDTSSDGVYKSLSTVPPQPDCSPTRMRHTPPPLPRIPPSNPLSPSKRSLSNYTPQSVIQASPKENFVPPPRPQTQSPGASRGKRGVTKPTDSTPRPSSAHAPTLPQPNASTQTSHTAFRARSSSQHLNLVPPTDGRQNDPLQRWHGSPCIAWGIGGLFVSTFPKDVPRYVISSTVPQVIRSPGEVKVQHMRDIQPLEDRLAKFPGPLKGKSKKKEVIGWLTAGINGLEMTLPNISFQQHVLQEDKRAVERVLLWKILRVLVENDGVLEGSPAVEKAVRDVISPGLNTTGVEASSAISIGAELTGMARTAAVIQADATDSTFAESIRNHLLFGDREKAVWEAVDKRLWGHAILIASSMPNPELYRQVAQEFIKKEVNHAGHGNESLAALYSVLSGNFEEAVDELVPSHARAGLQLMSASAPTMSQDVLAGLDQWRETLGLILSNRRQGDVQALRSLGNLLSGYGRAEAAHICYVFARQCAIFGGLDDPNASFVLVGADHRRQADQFAKETEALQLSEVYEYGLSLAPGSNVPQSCPHLAAYKLQHAMVLAEYGFRDKALQYCEAIWSAITSQTKKSPYFNPVLESAVDDMMRRLKQAAGDEPSSWITKPKMDQVSSNMWSRFTKFVAGPDEDGTGIGASGEGGPEVGPFARIAGGTPTMSRSPSVSNFEVYGNSPPMAPNRTFPAYSPTVAQSTAPQYEPIGTYNPTSRPSAERTSGDLQGSSEFARRGPDIQSIHVNPYAPVTISSSPPRSAYQPVASLGPETSPYAPTYQRQPPPSVNEQSVGYPGYKPFDSDHVPEMPVSTPSDYRVPETLAQHQALANDTSISLNYQTPSNYEPPSMDGVEPPVSQTEPSFSSYEPPSYQPSSFEPPSYEPGPTDDDESENKPKMKSFMNDDDDDIPGLRPKEKSKAEKDHENEEMFRKIAEEEAKRADEAKSAKKGGWGFGGWFGGGKKNTTEPPNKPIKAKLGEASSFVYDPDLKRWVNKKPGAENTPSKTATPPPPRAASTPPSSTSLAPPMSNTAPPPRPTPPPAVSDKAISQENLSVPGGAPLMARTISSHSNTSAAGGPPSAPPSRPATSLSNASSIDDLLGPAGPRKSTKKPRKSGRYVDVMAK